MGDFAMKLVKASEVDFQFPVIGFSREDGLIGFDDVQVMSRCHPALIEREAFIGMELVDTSLRRWLVRSLEIAKPLAQKKRWWQIFDSAPWPEFELLLESAPPVGFDELKQRFISETVIEEPDDDEAMRAAPDLATLVKESYMQCSGFL